MPRLTSRAHRDLAAHTVSDSEESCLHDLLVCAYREVQICCQATCSASVVSLICSWAGSVRPNDSEDRNEEIFATATLQQRSGQSLTVPATVITARAVKRSDACRLDVASLRPALRIT